MSSKPFWPIRKEPSLLTQFPIRGRLFQSKTSPRHTQKHTLALLLFSICLSCLPLRGQVTLQITGISSTEGEIRILIFSQASGFPEDRTKAAMEASVPATKSKGGELTLTFKDPPAKQGAIVVLHDLNRDGKAAKNLIGIPKEPIGISLWNGKRKPKFTKAILPLQGDIPLVLYQM